MAERARPLPAAAQRFLDSPQVQGSLRPWLGWVLRRHAALDAATEIRILAKGSIRGTWAGLFGPDDLERLVLDLAPATPRPRTQIPRGDHPRCGEANIYFGLHGVRRELAVDARRALARVRTTVKDRDIVAYTLFPVDVDPVREPRHLPASDPEKAAAREVAEAIRAWLGEHGVRSLLADSGNGHHLLVPLTRAAGEEVPRAARDAHDLLRLLDRRFSTEAAKVDTAIANPSRIFKLYGTLAVKGEPTADRPHRWAGIDLADIPADVDLFAILADELGRFRAAEAPARAPTRPPARRSTPPRPAPRTGTQTWKDWRGEVLAVLDLGAVYGELLTGKRSGDGWLQCRDPDSPTGDRHPSAGVADGAPEAERGTFHSFRSGESCSAFDFLVRLGRAADFRQACALVADLTGIPLPAGGPPSADPDAVMARFRDRWPTLPDDDARRALVRDTIAALLELSALERDPHLQEIRTLAGIRAEVFRETVAEVRRARREIEDARPAPPPPPLPPPPDDRPVVDYVTNRDTVDGLFDAITDIVRPLDRLFTTGQELVFVDPGNGPIPVQERNLGGLLSALLEVRFLAAHEDGDAFLRFGVLPVDLARAFVSSPRVRRRLPRLKTYARSPIFDTRWRFVGTPGFHRGSGVFYDGPEVQPTDGSKHLCEALQDFHFKNEADLVNVAGALVTAITMPHWGRGHPFLAINGNKPGVGKSTLARVVGVIVEGAEPHTVSYVPDDNEFEKQLATRVEAGDRIIVVDNAKTRRPIESAVLERCITDSRLTFRRLGSNTAITRPSNDILFCLTMNLTQMGPDLRRRALPVNLELHTNVRSVRYPVDDLVGAVLRHRLEILGELAGMVRAWLDADQPACEDPARHSTGQRWAATVDAILRLSGFDGFLTNFDASEHAFDGRYALMVEIAAEHHARPAATAADWAEWLGEGPLEERFKDRRGNLRTARARATIVGGLFNDYLDTTFDVDGKTFELVREEPSWARRSPTYGFREVGSGVGSEMGS